MLNKLRNIFSNSIDFEPDQEYNLSDKQIAWVQYNQIQKSIDQINCDITDLNYDYNEVLKGIDQADILQKVETKFLGKLKDLCELKNTKAQALEKAFVNIKGVIKNTDDFEYKKYLPQEGRLRSEMPQISAENIDDILIHFAQKSPNTKVTKKQMRLCDIKYIQTEFDDNKIIDILSQDNDFNNKYIISKDNYLIDANHRHASELEIDPVKEVTVLQINLPINELLRRCNLLKITKKESVQKSEVSDIELGKIQQDVLEKGGKKAQIGEIREWGGKKYQKTNEGWKPVKDEEIETFEPSKELYEQIKNTIYYHNTSLKSKESIEKEGWQIKKPTRGQFYGQGIYFNIGHGDSRWGEVSMAVKLNPKKVLYDPEGDMRYEDNALGRAILKYTGLGSEAEDPEKWRMGLSDFLRERGYDLIITEEYGKPIAVVLDPSIISNHSFEKRVGQKYGSKKPDEPKKEKSKKGEEKEGIKEQNKVEKAAELEDLFSNLDQEIHLSGEPICTKGSLLNKLLGKEIYKAKSGVYKNTAENRKKGRVGQHYGEKKEEKKNPDQEVVDLIAKSNKGFKGTYEDIIRWREAHKNGDKFFGAGLEKLADNNLTDLEATAVHNYTGAGFDVINRHLRENISNESIRKNRDILNEALDKFDSYEGLVFRRIDVDDLNEFFKTYKELEGSVIQYDAFTSTSKDVYQVGGFDGDVDFLIKSKTGKDISNLTSFHEEQEVLFKTGSQFLIKEVEMRKINLKEERLYITLEEV